MEHIPVYEGAGFQGKNFPAIVLPSPIKYFSNHACVIQLIKIVAEMHVGRGISEEMLADDGIMPDEETGGFPGKFERDARRNLIEQVAVKINRAAKDWLSAVAAVGGVD